MKIAVAQTKPIKGDVCANIKDHQRLIAAAAGQAAEMIVFPELSLTGYEPELVGELATDQEDPRFDELQKLSDARQMIIAASAPTRNARLPCISLVLFQSGQGRQTYSKQYLHADEEPFFSRGEHHNGMITSGGRKIALAICYELSVPAHAETACQNGATIYVASVAKTAKGVAGATERLSEIARRYSMPALMANCVGSCGGYDCAGGSAVWNRDGRLLAQLPEDTEGLLVIDTEDPTHGAWSLK